MTVKNITTAAAIVVKAEAKIDGPMRINAVRVLSWRLTFPGI